MVLGPAPRMSDGLGPGPRMSDGLGPVCLKFHPLEKCTKPSVVDDIFVESVALTLKAAVGVKLVSAVRNPGGLLLSYWTFFSPLGTSVGPEIFFLSAHIPNMPIPLTTTRGGVTTKKIDSEQRVPLLSEEV
jgi:hypothetical protein